MEIDINFEDNFMFILRAMVKASENKLKIVCYQKTNQDTVETTKEYYLELNNKRISNELDFYVSKSKIYVFRALPDFFIILMRLKDDCPESYRIGAMMLKKVGSEIFEGKILENWNNLFK